MGTCQAPRRSLHAITKAALLIILGWAVQGARRLQDDAIRYEGTIAGLFHSHQVPDEAQFEAIREVLATFGEDEEETDARQQMLLLLGIPSDSPLKPGKAIRYVEYYVTFNDSAITSTLNITDSDSVSSFVFNFRTLVAKTSNIPEADVIVRSVSMGDEPIARRLALATPLFTYLPHQLSFMFPPEAKVQELVLTRSFSGSRSTLTALRAMERRLLNNPAAETDNLQSGNDSKFSKRHLEGPTNDRSIVVAFTIVSYEDLPATLSAILEAPVSPARHTAADVPQTVTPHFARDARPSTVHLSSRSTTSDEEQLNIPLPTPYSHTSSSPAQSSSQFLLGRPGPALSVAVTNYLGQGTLHAHPDGTASVVWSDSHDFDSIRQPYSHFTLLQHDDSHDCSVELGVCTTCPNAWTANEELTSIPIYFRQPLQLDAIMVTQIQNPGLLSVELLPWPAVPIPEFPDLAPISGILGAPIYDVTLDVSTCGEEVEIRLPSDRSGLRLRVPEQGSQEALPDLFRDTAVGGVVLTVKRQLKHMDPTVFQSVSFSGRVLYPREA